MCVNSYWTKVSRLSISSLTHNFKLTLRTPMTVGPWWIQEGGGKWGIWPGRHYSQRGAKFSPRVSDVANGRWRRQYHVAYIPQFGYIIYPLLEAATGAAALSMIWCLLNIGRFYWKIITVTLFENSLRFHPLSEMKRVYQRPSHLYHEVSKQ